MCCTQYQTETIFFQTGDLLNRLSIDQLKEQRADILNSRYFSPSNHVRPIRKDVSIVPEKCAIDFLKMPLSHRMGQMKTRFPDDEATVSVCLTPCTCRCVTEYLLARCLRCLPVVKLLSLFVLLLLLLLQLLVTITAELVLLILRVAPVP